MMQIAASDEYNDYVICRGFDPRIQAFVDYEAGNEDKPGISVAKPFGKRGTNYYLIGQVFPALLPTQGTMYEGRPGTRDYVPPSPSTVDWRVGQNPGVAETSVGHPADLDEAITALKDHNDLYVNWMLIDSSDTERHFELKDALTPGGNATAHPLEWDSDAGDWTVDTDAADEFEVYDVLGVFRGRAKDAYGDPHSQGSRGVARYDGERGVWRIVELTPHALVIRGQLTAALATTDATCTIDGLEVMQPSGAIIVNSDPAAAMTSTNRHSHEGSEDGEVTAMWDEHNELFYNVQTDCP
jgi:hypothetical protein